MVDLKKGFMLKIAHVKQETSIGLAFIADACKPI